MSFIEIKTFLNKIGGMIGLNEQELNLLSTPNNILKADLKVNEKSYPAFRVQFNNARGPYKGGIRFHQEVDEDEIKSLAFWMSLKTAVVDLPLGGGKGGVRVNPKKLSKIELEKLSRAYIRAFYKHLGPDKDIPAPDVYTTPEIMAWMKDEYEKLVGYPAPGVITGKPLERGGSLVRDIATALGGVYVLEEAVIKLGLDEKTVVIQGFGNAGMNVAKLLTQRDYRIIAVSDSKGGVFNEDGLDVDVLVGVKQETGSVINYQNAEQISNEELLQIDCSILIPSALDDVITKENAGLLKAKIVLELANGPTTIEADKILYDREILVLPDILANAGGVTVSYFEWMQNQSNEKWDEITIKNKLKEKMINAFNNLWNSYSSNKFDFRTNAYIYAIKKIVEAEKDRVSA